MEALLFTFNSLVMILLVFMGLRDDRRAPGAPQTSLFRMRDTATGAPPPARPDPEQDWARFGRNDLP